MQTGTNFQKGGHLYFIKDHRDQISQASKAQIDYKPIKPMPSADHPAGNL
jgi:hypothetical protein